MATNKGLGKGFAALMPQNFDTRILIDENEKVYDLEISDIRPNEAQPRQYFDDVALEQLAQSIKQHGVLQPIVVTPLKGGGYQIIAGERRWRASALAGKKKIAAFIRTPKEIEQLEIALIENVQRVDLSPLEQARSIERLHQQFNVTYESIAKRLGKAPSTITNIVRLLQLPKKAFEALQEGKITEGHARAILSLKGHAKQQQALLDAILKFGWTVRHAERYATSVKSGIQERKEVHARVKTETPETKRLSKRIGAPVKVKRMAKGGRLEITFKNDEELTKIIKLLDKS